jgi:hypothetical protein
MTDTEILRFVLKQFAGINDEDFKLSELSLSSLGRGD